MLVVYVSRPISQIMIPSVLLMLMEISKRHLWFLYVAGSRVIKREHALHKSHSCASKCPLPLSNFKSFSGGNSINLIGLFIV